MVSNYKPSHHEISVRNSLGSKCTSCCVPAGSPKTQVVAKEAERRALFAGEDKLLKDKTIQLMGKISAREETRWLCCSR